MQRRSKPSFIELLQYITIFEAINFMVMVSAKANIGEKK